MVDIFRIKSQRLSRTRKSSVVRNTMSLKPISLDKVKKSKYTQDENYRAFKLFSIMDVDHNGNISLRELKRILMGETERTFTETFEHVDTGIIFGIDVQGYIIIESIEENSPASLRQSLIHALRVKEINNKTIERDCSLNELVDYFKYFQLQNEIIEIKFIEPLLILTSYSHFLDIEIENYQVFSIELPIGAVYDLKLFIAIIKVYLIDIDERHGTDIFKNFRIGCIPNKLQVFFKSKTHRFRFLFATGPNYHRSCRFAIGFSAEDYSFSNYFEGLPLEMDLGLGLSMEQLDVLTSELFQHFDKDLSGELDFEEFRDFYVTYLDTQESLESLKIYAQYRFRDLELEALYIEKNEYLKKRAAQKELSRMKNSEIKLKQRQARLQKSQISNDGMSRVIQVQEVPLVTPIVEIEESKVIEKQEKSFNSQSKYLEANDNSNMSKLNNQQSQSSTTSQTSRRSQHKQNILGSQYNRNMMNQNNPLENIEVTVALMKGVKEAFDQFNNNKHYTVGAVQRVFMDYIRTPALDIDNASIYAHNGNIRDLVLEELPPSVMHPGIHRYYMIPEEKISKAFDPTLKHPAFFSSDYQRQPKRYSSISMDICRLIESEREEGCIFRRAHNIKLMYHNLPDYEMKEKKKVRFQVPERIKEAYLVGRLTISTLTFRDLRQFNFSRKNSPFIKISSSFSNANAVEVSEINYNAGLIAEWDELNWIFRLYRNSNLQVEVYLTNETISSSVLFSKLLIPVENFLLYPFNKKSNSFVHFQKDLNDSSNSKIGELDVFCKFDPGDDWDWYLNESQGFANFNGNISIPNFNPLSNGLKFPLSFAIKLAKIVDTFHISKLFHNPKIQLQLDCGSARYFTKEKKLIIDGEIESIHLDWDIVLMLPTSNFIMIIIVNDVQISSFSISAQEISLIPNDSIGKFQIKGIFSANNINYGRILLECYLQSSAKDTLPDVMTSEFMANSISALSSSSSMISDGPQEDCINIPSYSDISTTIVTSEFNKKYSVSSISSSLQRLFPLHVTILSITGSDLRVAHIFQKNLPKITISCGSWANSSVSTSLDGSIASFDNLDWKFIIIEKLQIHITLYSRETIIGSADIKSSQLVPLVENQDKTCELFVDISLNKVAAGKLKIVLSIHSPINNSSDMINDKEEDVSASSSVLEKFLSKDITFINPPFRIIIYSIRLFEMKAVHMFLSNSPCVKASCERDIKFSSVIDFGGENALWSNLLWIFHFSSIDSKFTLTVISGSVVIGKIFLTGKDVLGIPVDNYGISTIHDFVRENDNSNVSAKVTIVYRVEPFYDALNEKESINDMNENTSISNTITFENSNQNLPIVVESDFNSETVPSESQSIKEDSNVVDINLNAFLYGYHFQIWNVQVIDVFIDFNESNKFQLNSPYVRLEYRNETFESNAKYMSSNSLFWKQLGWKFNLNAHSSFKISIISGNEYFGESLMNIETLLKFQSECNQPIFICSQSLKKHSIDVGKISIALLLFEIPNQSITKPIAPVRSSASSIFSYSTGKNLETTISSNSYITMLEEYPVNNMRRHALFDLAAKSSFESFSMSNEKENLISFNSSISSSIETDRNSKHRYSDEYIDFGSKESDFYLKKENVRKILNDDDISDKYCVIKAIILSNLHCAHKHGKNSPYIILESDRWRLATSAVPLAGTSASWEEVSKKLPLVPMSPINVSVKSGSALIGSAKIDIKDIECTIIKDSFVEVNEYIFDIKRDNNVTGNVIVVLQLDSIVYCSYANDVSITNETPNELVLEVNDSEKLLSSPEIQETSSFRTGSEFDEFSESISLNEMESTLSDDPSNSSWESSSIWTDELTQSSRSTLTSRGSFISSLSNTFDSQAFHDEEIINENIPVWKDEMLPVVAGYLVRSYIKIAIEKFIKNYNPQVPIVSMKKNVLMWNKSSSQIRRNNNVHPSSLTYEHIRLGIYHPSKILLTIHELTSIDLSSIPNNLLPKRPYLTACKPFSNWAMEATSTWSNPHSFDKPQSLALSFIDLLIKFHWEPFRFVLSEVIVFDLRDQVAGGLIIAKAKLEFRDLFEYQEYIQEDGMLSIPLRFQVAKEYSSNADISFVSCIKLHLDYSIDFFQRPIRSRDYWDNKRRIHHWRVYPIPPISTGFIRQKFPDIALEYDRQMIIHPVFFGYDIRWRSNISDESRFIHPLFWGYTLHKQGLSTEQKEQIELLLQSKSLPNQYQYDPFAKLQQRCPCCGDGLDGCPRCYMLPSSCDGNKLSLEDFAFSMKDINKASNTKDDNDNIPIIHTKFTTYESLRLYRTFCSRLCTIYIKVMPSGCIRKLIVDTTKDTIFQLYHNFHSHSRFGVLKSPMMILPTEHGLFELTNTMSHGHESLLPDLPAFIPLRSYGIEGVCSDFNNKLLSTKTINQSISPPCKIVLLYFPNYYENSRDHVKTMMLQTLSRNWKGKFETNDIYKSLEVSNDFHVIDSLSPSAMPRNLINDKIQQHFLNIVTIQYKQQQRDLRDYHKELGLAASQAYKDEIKRLLQSKVISYSFSSPISSSNSKVENLESKQSVDSGWSSRLKVPSNMILTEADSYLDDSDYSSGSEYSELGSEFSDSDYTENSEDSLTPRSEYSVSSSKTYDSSQTLGSSTYTMDSESDDRSDFSQTSGSSTYTMDSESDDRSDFSSMISSSSSVKSNVTSDDKQVRTPRDELLPFLSPSKIQDSEWRRNYPLQSPINQVNEIQAQQLSEKSLKKVDESISIYSMRPKSIANEIRNIYKMQKASSFNSSKAFISLSEISDSDDEKSINSYNEDIESSSIMSSRRSSLYQSIHRANLLKAAIEKHM